MILKTKLFGHVYEFKSIREVMAKANEEKSGDKLAGIAAETAEERVAAKVVLSNLTLNDLRNCPAVPYEEDEVTRIIQDSVNETIFNEYKNMTVAEFREWLLDAQPTPDMIRRASRGLTSEIVAGVCKLMSNLDLIYAAKKMRVTAHCNTTIGLPGTFSSRLQPNHTTDDPNGIIASVMEGLSLGCGDAVIGLNPSGDTAESVRRVLTRFDEVRRRLELVGAPYEPEQIGVSRTRFREAFGKIPYMRSRYTVIDTAFRCGWMEEWLARLFGKGGVWEVGSPAPGSGEPARSAAAPVPGA